MKINWTSHAPDGHVLMAFTSREDGVEPVKNKMRAKQNISLDSIQTCETPYPRTCCIELLFNEQTSMMSFISPLFHSHFCDLCNRSYRRQMKLAPWYPRHVSSGGNL